MRQVGRKGCTLHEAFCPLKPTNTTHTGGLGSVLWASDSGSPTYVPSQAVLEPTCSSEVGDGGSPFENPKLGKLQTRCPSPARVLVSLLPPCGLSTILRGPFPLRTTTAPGGPDEARFFLWPHLGPCSICSSLTGLLATLCPRLRDCTCWSLGQHDCCLSSSAQRSSHQRDQP